MCLDTGLVRTGCGGTVTLLGNFTRVLTKLQSLSLDSCLTEETAVAPGELGRKCSLLSWCLQLLILDVSTQISKHPWTILGAFPRNFPHFQGPSQFYKPAFVHLNIMHVETHVICLLTEGFAPCYGMCLSIHWMIWCMSLPLSPGITTFYRKPIQLVAIE